jgi:hypothetical protein
MKESTLTPRGEWGSHHPIAPVVSKCPVAYCDVPNLMCMVGHRGPNSRANRFPLIFFTCCNAKNPETLCIQPPCWFYGNSCPLARMVGQSPLQQSRRLEPAVEAGNLKSPPRKLTATEAAAPADNGTNIPGEGAVIAQLESDENTLLADTIVVQATVEKQDAMDLRLKARDVAKWASMPEWAGTGTELRQDAVMAASIEEQIYQELQRLSAQIVTRVAVLRDTICKLGIVQMNMNEEPLRFTPPAYDIYFGKTRNMSQVHQSLKFSDKFVVPSTVGDAPTPDDPRTAFSFIFLKYKQNIYGWSQSSPPGVLSPQIITLIVMSAAAPLSEVVIENETNPVQVFCDQAPIWSNGLCMYWDRFAANAPGGAWSSRGLLNNADACLTTHLSDMGLFIDGRLPDILKVDSAASLYVEEFEDVGMNFSMVAILALIILVGTILSCAAYIQDELERERQRSGKFRKATYHLDGDGVNEPINVRDPIAYKHAGHRNRFLALTFWHVIQRDHALISPLFFSEGFSRPQRILCLGVMVTGVLAINAAVYGNPSYLISSDQYFPSGILSGLIVFPLYCTCVVMFAARPTYLKKRLPKKKTREEAVQVLQKARQDMVHKSSLRPPPGYIAMPPLPALGGAPPTFAGATFLQLPATALPQLPPVLSLIPSD